MGQPGYPHSMLAPATSHGPHLPDDMGIQKGNIQGKTTRASTSERGIPINTLSGPSTVLSADAIFSVAWPREVTCAKIPRSAPLIGQYDSNLDGTVEFRGTFQNGIVRLGPGLAEREFFRP